MSLDEAFQWLFAHVPWYVAAFALLATVALSLAFNLPGWLASIIGSIRLAAASAMLPKLSEVPREPPDPGKISDGGTAEDAKLPPAQVVDGNGDPVQLGRTEAEIESEPSGG